MRGNRFQNNQRRAPVNQLLGSPFQRQTMNRGGQPLPQQASMNARMAQMGPQRGPNMNANPMARQQMMAKKLRQMPQPPGMDPGGPVIMPAPQPQPMPIGPISPTNPMPTPAPDPMPVMPQPPKLPEYPVQPAPQPIGPISPTNPMPGTEIGSVPPIPIQPAPQPTQTAISDPIYQRMEARRRSFNPGPQMPSPTRAPTNGPTR